MKKMNQKRSRMCALSKKMCNFASAIKPNTTDNIPKFFVSDFPPYEVIYVKITVLLSV